MPDVLPGLAIDFAVCVLIFVQWIAAGVLVDVNPSTTDTQKAVALYLAISSGAVVAVRVFRTYMTLGTWAAAKRMPETLPGLFFEIVALAQVFGLMFAAARALSLPTTHAFFRGKFLDALGKSIFDMSLVMSGVGLVDAVPTTLAEFAVVWCTSYIGGVFVVTMLLLSVVLDRRGWWSQSDDDASRLYVRRTIAYE